MADLPTFKYHPDPIASGSVVAMDDVTCPCCEKVRGYVLTIAPYCDVELDNRLCPWCVADGSAYEKYNAQFNESLEKIENGVFMPIDVSDESEKEVTQRTPGFATWQYGWWLTCCGDAAAFLGLAGKDELESKWAGAVPSIRDYIDYSENEGVWDVIFESMDKDASPKAYVFQCLHCNNLLGYWDCI